MNLDGGRALPALKYSSIAGDLIMFNLEVFDSALQQPWTSVYAKVMALVLLYGATVHIGNMAGLTGTPWMSTPLLWQGMDVTLLIFDVTTAIALWRGLAWSVWLVFGGIILLQFVPIICCARSLSSSRKMLRS